MKRVLALAAAVVLAIGSAVQAETRLLGSGSSFVNPIMQKWIETYQQAHPDVKIDYQAVGSGKGIKNFSDGTVDFAGTDAFMTEKQLKELKGEALHIPVVMGAVVPVYNLPGVDKPLVFSGEVLGGIFGRKITKWNDAKLAELNPGVKLPDSKIIVVRRSDGSGTTAIFTDYLAKTNPTWKSTIGSGTSPKWPEDTLGGDKNPGVAALVKQNAGAIGYVELLYALEQGGNLSVGKIKNAAGKVVEPSIASTSAAAASLKDIPADLRISLTNAPGDEAYPIAGTSWLILPKDIKDAAKAKALVDFVSWTLHDGQAMAQAKFYAPIPEAIVKIADAKLHAVQSGGKAVLDSK